MSEMKKRWIALYLRRFPDCFPENPTIYSH